MIKILFSIIITTFFFGCNINDKTESKNNNSIITKYTELKQIISKEVDDTFYIYVRLPKNYESTNKRYPVLYLLDGDISFNMATSIVRYLQFGKDVPDLIIVAPGYGTLLNDIETNYRERDYTFSEFEKFANSGGGERYLMFIEKELIPFIDSSYRTNKKRILNGYSLGGLFAINSLIRTPNLFDNYIVGSPYLVNDADLINKKLIDISFSSPIKKIFISVGELEEIAQYHKPIKTIVDNLEEKDGIRLHFVEFKNGTHFTCPTEALTYGLKFIFSDTTFAEP
jgi:predicted alpha/beta superfamily hydrolase